MKKALITGITGQDGSYLAEFLLNQNYEVHGIIRRSSSFNTVRIDHIFKRLCLHYGDLSDGGRLTELIYSIRPDEIYNLGAQSHVRVSFDIPEYTGDIVALGTIRILEAIRKSKMPIKFYQASSSEMFGNAPAPQNENTPFDPRSPYAVAKVYAYNITKNYREAYGIFACNGILFNHESVTGKTPVILRHRHLIDIVPIEDLIQRDLNGQTRTTNFDNLEVWDQNGFTKIHCGTSYKHARIQKNKNIKRIISQNGLIEATGDHVFILNNHSEKCAQQLNVGSKLSEIPLPELTQITKSFFEESAFLGYMIKNGSVLITNKHGIYGKYINKNPDLLEKVGNLWVQLTGGYYSFGEAENTLPYITLNGDTNYLKWLHANIYTKAGEKKIPKKILNTNSKNILAFLKAYNENDELLTDKCTIQRFGTSSATLALGLWYLITKVLRRNITFFVFKKPTQNGLQYRLDLLDTDALGERLKKSSSEITQIESLPDYEGYLYDLCTESGTFHAGIGNICIHNSPRRGETFVTRKITKAVGRIKRGEQKYLYLGNLESKRDWGFAGDYVYAMWLMLQQNKPGDYVIGTGETHTVREFLEEAFSFANLNWRDHVLIDSKYFRPTEVDLLLADPTKAKIQLKWKPSVNFKQLVQMMVNFDLQPNL